MADNLFENSPKRFWPCKFDGCSSYFTKKDHLVRHERIHTDERPFACTKDGCSKAFRTACHLKRHEATHVTLKQFKCEYENCTVECATLWNLKRHVKRTHQGKFKCKECGKEFKKNKLYKDHIYLEHKSTKFCCQFTGCGQVFTESAKLKTHMKCHTNKEYSCAVKDCSMKFNFWSECRLHMAQCKKKEKECDVCGKVFTEGSNLKAHKKIHLEEREVFQCTYDGCGRFYTKQCNLKAHIQSFHQNIRPYICPKDKCKKSFHFKHLLRRHLEHHANMKAEEAPKKRKRPSRSRRDMLLEGLTGYTPELTRNLPSSEVDSYYQQFMCVTEPVSQTDEGCEQNPPTTPPTTQEEMTPVVSSDVASSSELPNVERLRMHPIIIDRDTEETLTATTPEMDCDESDLVIVLEPLKSYEQAHQILNANQQQVSTSTTNSTCASVPEINESNPGAIVIPEYRPLSTSIAERVAQFGEKLQMIVERRRKAHFSETCAIQSVTESDSSDTESNKKLQMLLQKCS